MVTVPSLTVIAPTSGSVNEPNAASTSNGVFYGVITGIARPFRGPGIPARDPLPPSSPCCIPRFDENPERLRVDSDGQVGASALEVTTGALVTNLIGPLDFGFRTYTILPDPATPPAGSGNVSAAPLPARPAGEATVAGWNLERFFDELDDVNNPNDPVLTATAFANRLNKASLAIRDFLRAPDLHRRHAMRPAWLKLLLLNNQRIRFGLTFPFLIGALREPPGSTTNIDTARDELTKLLESMRDGTPESHVIRIADCDRLHQPVAAPIPGMSTPGVGFAALPSPNRSKVTLYVSEQYFHGAPHVLTSYRTLCGH